MADLSKVLDALYGETTKAPADKNKDVDGAPASEAGPGDKEAARPLADGPAWASNEALDAAFSGWAPGTDPATHAEKRFSKDSPDLERPLAQPGGDQANSAAAVAETAVLPALGAWRRHDDDILPTSSTGPRLIKLGRMPKLSLRRRSQA